eukprot:GHVQ01023216.1.p1 GENE.GHVQ01023216.1~~GHVQ01023216.1.p1  ORF type:complete len:910 (+),score=74.34 GHVQ01023216.1:241-2730(+)
MVAIGNTKTGRVVDEANSTSKPSDTITKRTRDTEKGQTIRRVTRRRIRPEDIAYSRRNEEADVPKCQHLVVIHGMCVNCCEAVSEDTTIHAPGFISNEIGLRMNKQYAADLERRELESLLTSRKLCLILDLDNTLLHASGVPVPQDLGVQVIELPCGEEHPWYFVENKCQSCSQHDTEHSSCRRDQCLCEFRRTQYGDINNDSTKSAMKALESCVVKAVLRGGSCTGGGVISYYKLRPGVLSFLKEMSHLFELYLYTMGTAEHADAALKILDPMRQWFANRVFTRGDGLNGVKCINRIFPNDRRMLIIVDDSEHAWPGMIDCLIKVHPYHYFPDISAHFIGLARPETLTKAMAAASAHCHFSPEVLTALHGYELFHPEIADIGEGPQLSGFDLSSSTETLSEALDKHSATRDPGGTEPSPLASHEAVEPTTVGSVIHDNLSRTVSSSSVSIFKHNVHSNRESFAVITHSSSELVTLDIDKKPTIEPLRATASSATQGNLTHLNLPTGLNPTTDPQCQDVCDLPFRQKKRNDDEPSKFMLPSPYIVRHFLYRKGSSSSLHQTTAVQHFGKHKDRNPKETYIKNLTEADKQLSYLGCMLRAIHRIYFRSWDCVVESTLEPRHCGAISDIFSQTGWMENIPDIAFVMRRIQSHTLQGVVLSASGLRSPAMPEFCGTDLAWWAQRLGAVIVELDGESRNPQRPYVTHLVCFADTDKLRWARAHKIFTPHLMWLEKALYTWRKPDETEFDFSSCAGRYMSLWDAPSNDHAVDSLYADIDELLFGRFFRLLKQSGDLAGCYAKVAGSHGDTDTEEGCNEDGNHSLYHDFFESLLE